MNTLYRSLILTGVLAVALSGYAGNDATIAGPRPPAPLRAPASVTKLLPAASTTTTTMTVSGCDFTVTYTWNGLTGRQLIATFGLYQRVGTLDESFNLTNVEGQLGKGGTLSHTFKLTAGVTGGRTILARGSLVDDRKYAQVSGSSSASSPVSSTCG